LKKKQLKSPPKITSRRELLDLQRIMTAALFRPLTKSSRMQRKWSDGRSTSQVVSQFIKPNDRLTSFERLEIYNRQYWFRVLDSFYDDYPASRAVLGDRVFLQMAEAYFVKHPSRSFTMRNLGSRLENFLMREPKWAGDKIVLARDVVRFEWAQILAFDEATVPPAGMTELVHSSPEKVRLRLQPHVQLLELWYPVDHFVISVKKHEALRGEASNAMTSAPVASKLKKVPLPKRDKTYVAVHRHGNAVYHKRLEPEAYHLLNSLRKGETLEEACQRALRRAAKRVDWHKNLTKWFENWSALGWFFLASTP
jgi:hypothetical protein